MPQQTTTQESEPKQAWYDGIQVMMKFEQTLFVFFKLIYS